MLGRGEAEERKNRAAHKVLRTNHIPLMHYMAVSLLVTKGCGSEINIRHFTQ